MAEIQSMEYGMKLGLPYPPLGTIRASVGKDGRQKAKRDYTQDLSNHIFNVISNDSIKAIVRNSSSS